MPSEANPADEPPCTFSGECEMDRLRRFGSQGYHAEDAAQWRNGCPSPHAGHGSLADSRGSAAVLRDCCPFEALGVGCLPGRAGAIGCEGPVEEPPLVALDADRDRWGRDAGRRGLRA